MDRAANRAARAGARTPTAIPVASGRRSRSTISSAIRATGISISPARKEPAMTRSTIGVVTRHASVAAPVNAIDSGTLPRAK